MLKKITILLLGESMLMEGIASSIGGRQAHITTSRNCIETDLRHWLIQYKPDLILFELAAEWMPSILLLLNEQPGILLMGVDMECSRVIVMNSHQQVPQSLSDLHQLFFDELEAAAGV